MINNGIVYEAGISTWLNLASLSILSHLCEAVRLELEYIVIVLFIHRLIQHTSLISLLSRLFIHICNVLRKNKLCRWC